MVLAPVDSRIRRYITALDAMEYIGSSLKALNSFNSQKTFRGRLTECFFHLSQLIFVGTEPKASESLDPMSRNAMTAYLNHSDLLQSSVDLR